MIAVWQWLTDGPGGAFILPIILCSYVLLSELYAYVQRRIHTRLSDVLYVAGVCPDDDTVWQHKYLPWRRRKVFGTWPAANNQRGYPHVVVTKPGQYRWTDDMPLSMFLSRYKEIK